MGRGVAGRSGHGGGRLSVVCAMRILKALATRCGWECLHVPPSSCLMKTTISSFSIVPELSLSKVPNASSRAVGWNPSHASEGRLGYVCSRMKRGLGGQEWNELVAKVEQPTQPAENFWCRAVRLACLHNFFADLP